MTASLLILAAIADSVTFVLMGTAHEANPIAAHYPVVALAAKAIVLVVLLAAPLGRYARRVQTFGALAWSLGFASNVAVLWR